MPTCAQCAIEQPRTCFSSAQLKKKQNSKCKTCVTNSQGEEAVLAAGHCERFDVASFKASAASDDTDPALDISLQLRRLEDMMHAFGEADVRDEAPLEAPLESLERHGLRMETDEDAGRSLVVSRSFERGDELLRELPAASVLFDEPWTALEHQLAARFQLTKLAPPYRLLAHMLLSNRELFCDGHAVMAMAANMELTAAKWPAAFVAALVEIANDASVRPSGSPLLALTSVSRMFAIIKTNAFGIYAVGERGLHNVGIGLYRLAGLANHTCDPSAVWTFDVERRQIVFRALRPLRAGGEASAVSISYLLSREPPAARQHKLRELYRFECACERCAREAPHAVRLNESAAAFRSSRDAIESALDGAASGAVQAEQVARCVRLLDELTPPDDCHPEAATSRLSLGHCYWRLAQGGGGGQRGRAQRDEHARRALECWRHAREMLSVCMSEDHALLPVVDRWIRDAAGGV